MSRFVARAISYTVKSAALAALAFGAPSLLAPQSAQAQQLLLYYNFSDGNLGGTDLSGIAGHPNGTQMTGDSTLVAGPASGINAVHFVGSDGPLSGIDSGLSSSYTGGLGGGSLQNGPFTVSAWVNLDNTNGDNMVFGSGGGNAPLMHLGFRNNQPYFGFWGNDSGGGTIAAGGWHQVTWTYDPNNGGGTQAIYMDGVQVSSQGGHGTFGQDKEILIGSNSGNGGAYAGSLTDVRIYNAVASGSQITALAATAGTAYDWNTSASTAPLSDWNTASNWSGGVVPGFGISDAARFGSTATIGAGATVNLNGNQILGQLINVNSNAWTLASGTPSTSSVRIREVTQQSSTGWTISAPITIDGSTLTFDSTGAAGSVGDTNVNGVISGGSGAGIVVNTAGSVVLGAANTFNGTTRVTAGTVRLAHANALQNSIARVNATNGLAFASSIGTFNLPGLIGTGSVALADQSSAAVTLNLGGSADAGFLGNLTGSGTLNKVGSNNQTLSGNNTFGSVRVSSGTLTAGYSAAGATPLGTGTVTLAGGTLGLAGQQPAVQTGGLQAFFINGAPNVNNADPNFNSLQAMTAHFLNPANIAMTAATNAGGQTNLDFSGGNYSHAAVFQNLGYTGQDNYEVMMNGMINITTSGNYTFKSTSDDGSMVFVDGQTIVNNNFYQGPTTRSGSIFLSAGQHAIATGFYQGGGGEGVLFQYNGPDTGNADATISNSVLNTLNQPLSVQTYANNLVVTASSGISVSNSVTATVGTVAIGSSTLSVSSQDQTGLPYTLNTGAVTLSGNATFNVSNSPTAAGTLRVASISDGNGGFGFTKAGNGTMVLSSPAGYSGGVTVSGGTLAVYNLTGNPISSAAVTLSGGVLSLRGQKLSSGLGALVYQGSNNETPYMGSLPAMISRVQSIGNSNISYTGAGSQTNLDFSNGGYGQGPAFSSIGFGNTVNYVTVMQGAINITTAGLYTFATTSDDASILYLDSNTGPTVNNNFIQGPTTRTGTQYMTAGMHYMTVGFHQAGGGQGILVQYSGPDTNNTNATISNSVLTTFAPNQSVGSAINVTADSGIDVGGSLTASVGAISIGANTLSITSPDAGSAPYSVTTPSITLSGNAMFNVNNSVGGGTGRLAPATIAGGTNSITKTGTGTLLLGSANTYAGTTISQGTVAVNALTSGTALGSGPVTLSGGTLALLGGQANAPGSGLTFKGYTNQPNGGNYGSPAGYYSSGSAMGAHFNGLTPAFTAATTANGQTNLNFPDPGNGAAFNNLGYTQATDFESVMTGIINITNPGTYFFQTTSDDGSVVYIDNAANPVVNNNAFQGPTTLTGAPVNLTAGQHLITVGFYQGGGGGVLNVSYNGPDTGNSFTAIPNSVLSQTAASQVYTNGLIVTANSGVDVSGSLNATVGPVSINGSTLSVTSSDPFAAPYSLTTGAVTLSGNPTFSVANSNSGGAGALTLGALNDGGSARTITASGGGTLRINSPAASLVTGTQLIINNNTTVNSSNSTGLGSAAQVAVNSGTFRANASQTISSLSGPGNVVIGSGNTLRVGSTDNLSSSFSGLVQGAGSLEKAGTGTLTLGLSNTHSGGTTVSNGLLVASTTGSLGAGAVTMNGGTLRLSNSTGGVAVAGFGGSGTNWTVNNSNIGGTPITGDILTLTDGNGGEARSAFYNTPVNLRNGATGFVASFNYQSSGAGTHADGATFTLQNAGANAIGAGGGGLGYSGITPSAALALNIYPGAPGGVGTSLSTGGVVTQPFSATGTLNIDSGNPIGVTLTYNPVAQTLLEQLSDPIAGTSFSATYNNVNLANIITPGVNSPVYVGFTGGTGGAAATQTISSFSYNVAAINSAGVYSNNVLLASGTTSTIDVAADANNSAFAMGSLSVAGPATLNVTASTAPSNQAYSLSLGATTLSGNVTLNVANNGTGVGTLQLGAVSGSGAGITTTGQGTVVLGNANSYSGATNVNAGTLRLADGSTNNIASSPTIAIASGAKLDVTGLNASTLTLASGQTLGGAGTVHGSLVAVNGSTVSAASGGSLTIDGSSGLTLNSGSIATFALGAPNGSGSTGLVNITTGSLALNTASTIQLTGSLQAGTYDLFSFTGSGPSSGFTVSNLTGNNTLGYSLAYLPHEVDLIVSNAAASAQWNVNGDGSYNQPNNWSASAPPNGPVVPNGATLTATFGNGGSVPVTGTPNAISVTVDTAVTAGHLVFSNTTGVTFNLASDGTHSLSLNNSGGTATIDATASASIQANLILADSQGTTITVATGKTVDISGAISGTAGTNGLIKAGAGTLRMDKPSTYTGATTVNAGNLVTTLTGTVGSGPLAVNSTSGTSVADLGVTQSVSSLSGTVSSGTARVQIEPGATLTVNQSANTTFQGGATLVAGGAGLTKSGSGHLTIGGTTALNDGASLTVSADNGHTNKLTLSGSSATVGSGVSATIGSGATLELAGSASALGTATVVDRAHVVDNGSLVSTAGNQIVGGIDGADASTPGDGSVTVGNGAALQADHLVINGALTIGDSGAVFTIAPSNSSGNPTSILGAGGSSSSLSQLLVTRSLAASHSSLLSGGSLSSVGSVASLSSGSLGGTAAVPEPSSVVLLCLGAACGLGLVARRRRAR